MLHPAPTITILSLILVIFGILYATKRSKRGIDKSFLFEIVIFSIFTGSAIYYGSDTLWFILSLDYTRISLAESHAGLMVAGALSSILVTLYVYYAILTRGPSQRKV